MISRAAQNRIVEDIAREWRMTREEIAGRGRGKRVVRARRQVVRALRLLDVPLIEIGRHIGRHHATVLYYLGSAHNERPFTPRTAWRMAQIRRKKNPAEAGLQR